MYLSLKRLEEPAFPLGGWGISDRTRVDVMGLKESAFALA